MSICHYIMSKFSQGGGIKGILAIGTKYIGFLCLPLVFSIGTPIFSRHQFRFYSNYLQILLEKQESIRETTSTVIRNIRKIYAKDNVTKCCPPKILGYQGTKRTSILPQDRPKETYSYMMFGYFGLYSMDYHSNCSEFPPPPSLPP